jgi:hypothetical protein
MMVDLSHPIEYKLTDSKGRCATVKDIANIAPYFFRPPNLDSAESMSMRYAIPKEHYGIGILQAAVFPTYMSSVSALNAFQAASERPQGVSSWLPNALQHFSGPKKFFWCAIRHSLSGQKVIESLFQENNFHRELGWPTPY